ncbi:zinc finger protein 91 isoform X1 [Oncorhynchus kisutch]|uniref:zinc finger protein 91 isoform X1 n=1 Tax=Oncorhynchus kisutch TaxID=8019 RepID=UPI0012DD3C40|nr:zinc finger protein 91 isoform X1 [Oncorhynchus kisutch]
MEDVSAVTIKDEGGDEQESEDVSENLTKKTENSANKSAKDDSTDGDGLFRCLDCEEVFGEEAAYQEHQHEHTHDGPIVCLDSDSHLDGLLVSESGGQRTLCCALCGRKFADSRGFYSHQVKHRNEALKQSTPVLQSTPVAQSTAGPQSTPDQSLGVAKQYVYECEDCGKSYTSMGSFISHTRSHKQASKSVFHELAHLKKKSFECQTCGRCYSRSSALDAHRRCHEVKLIPKSRKRDAEKQPPAEEPAIATEDSNKASEQVDEAQENLFGCSCGKTFRAQSGLKTHQRFSHNDKCSPEKLKRKPNKFDCSECEKTFSTYAGMLCHQRYHMKRGGSSGKRFPCEECDKVFTTLTFYYKHQRLAHTQETPAKSFLHQVCQLQKKAFECQECGLRFSRASALQSHRLCHNDVFGRTEKEFQTQTSPLPQHKLLLDNKTETETFALGAIVFPQDTLQTPVTERDPCFYETDGDAEADGTDDVNVEVISISASDGSVRDEEESQQELNPDLELLCESDQEGKEEMDAVLCPTEYISSTLKSKPEIDLKIVQIDFPPFVGEGTQTEKVQGLDPPKRFNCPECYRWFTSAASLRSHKLWHRVDGKKRWNPEKDIFKCDFCGFDTTHRKTYHNHMRKHDGRKPHKSVLYQLAGLQKNSFKCEVCGKCFSRMSALHSHQQQHPKSKAHPCPDCEKTYSNASGLYNHRKSCHAPTPTPDEVSDTKTEVFNPKKTLLGPTVYCERCGKGFWSLGAYAHHKQNQAQCAHLKEKHEPTVSSHSVNGPPHVRGKVACPVCRKTFRHQGIMKSHMRKHENGNHRCELCSKSFRMFSSLLRHQVVHNAQILPPPIKSFQHQVEQVKKNTYSCPDCGKLFSRAKALKFHMKSHGYETDYSASSPKSALELEGLKCSTCLSHFSNKSSLHTHQKQCGKKNTVSKSYKEDVVQHDTVPKVKKLKCPSCPSLFNNLLSLQYHRKECGKPSAVAGLDVKAKGGIEKVTKCIVKDLVETTLSNNSGTEKMTKSVTEKERGEQKETSESQTLKKAATINTTDLKYKCKECERSFAVVGALNFHKRIHVLGHKSKVKPKLKFQVAAIPEEPKQPKKVEQTTKGQFCCPECGRRFISNAALGTHRRWHTDKKFAGSLIKDDNISSVGHKSVDEGPFQCNKCGKGFFYLCVLRRHQLYYPPCQTKAEPEPAADTSMEGNHKPSHAEFACPECNTTFVKGSLLAAHYESEHNKPIESADLQGDQSMTMSIEEVPEQPATSHSKSEVIPLKKPKLKLNLHQCPHCDMSFLKVRGLRAHKWQAHSQGKKVKSKGTLAESGDSVAINTLATKGNELINESKDLVTENKGIVLKTEHFVTKNKNAVGRRRKKGRPGFKSIPCVDCGKRYSSSGALYNHKKICGVLKQEVNPGMAEVVEEEPSPPTLLYEQTIKYLFKCDKCGKAFPTEEQLGTHKDLAKSRPHSCALCCRGYWTETQLQQHLAWHDEVRRRLPTELRYRLRASVSTGPAKLNVSLPDLKAKSSLKPLPTPPSRPQNSHKCQHCGKAFLSPGALHKHEAQHDSDGSYRCSLCPRTFSEIRDLIDHHQECMGDDKVQRDPYTAVSSRDTDGLTCIECGMRFSRELELHQHYIEHARGAY